MQRSIGTDFGVGVSYRPPLTENIVLTTGVSALVPDRVCAISTTPGCWFLPLRICGYSSDGLSQRGMNATEWQALSGWGCSSPWLCCLFTARSRQARRICRRSRIAAPRRQLRCPHRRIRGTGLRIRQSQDDVDAKSAGCQSCHTATDSAYHAYISRGSHRMYRLPRRGCDHQRSGRPFSYSPPNIKAPSSGPSTAQGVAKRQQRQSSPRLHRLAEGRSATT